MSITHIFITTFYICPLSAQTSTHQKIHRNLTWFLHNLRHNEKLATRFYRNNQWMGKLHKTRWSVFSHLYVFACRTVAQSFCSITLLRSWKIAPPKYLSTRTDNYLISHLQKLLPLLKIGLSASNIMISTRMSYHELKVREIPFFTHSRMRTGIHITTLNP